MHKIVVQVIHRRCKIIKMEPEEKNFSSLAPQKTRLPKNFFLWVSLVFVAILFAVGYYLIQTIFYNAAYVKQSARAETKHRELALFVENVRVTTAGFGVDDSIRGLTQKIHDGGCAKAKAGTICPLARELSDHLAKNELPLDPSIGIIDILNIDGIVVASSEPARIGLNTVTKTISFPETKTLPFGQTLLFPEIVLSDSEMEKRTTMIHITTPIASSEGARLVGVLLTHTKNKGLNDLLAPKEGNTTETYLVNNQKIMVTPSRFVSDAVLNQKVDTMPVRECTEHGASFKGSYPDYRGVQVIGASVCDPALFGTLVAETDKDELFTEISTLRNGIIVALFLTLVLLFIYLTSSKDNLFYRIRRIFPDTLSSILSIGAVIITAVIGVAIFSFIFSRAIETFIVDTKIHTIFNLVKKQAERHLDDASAFYSWGQESARLKFQDFEEGVLASFSPIIALELHTPQGILIWSSFQKEAVGTSPEADEVSRSIHAGMVTAAAFPSITEKLGTKDIIEIYVPIRGEDDKVAGVAEVYTSTSDITLFTQNIRMITWGAAALLIVLIFLLLRFAFRRYETTIFEQSERLRGVIEKSPIGIFMISKNGTIETFNPSLAQMSGIPDAREVIGKNVFEMNRPQDPILDKLIKEGMKGADYAGSGFEVARTENNGKKTYHQYYRVSLKNTDGDIERILFMVEDTTKRKELENEVWDYAKNLEKKVLGRTKDIEEEKVKDEAILENLGEGMITTDNTGNIIIINHAAEKMLGWKKEEVIGKSFVEVIPAVDEEEKMIPKEKRAMSIAITTGTTTTSGNIQLTKKDGSLIPVVATVTPVILNGKIIGAVSIFRDVAKEKELEQARRDLLSLASHQLRTPLSGTKWLIETLKRGLHGPLTPGQTEYIDEIYKINEKMTTLVHDMLGVLRMEGDASLAKKENVSVKTVLDIVFETLGGAAKSKNVTLRFADGAENTIETDPVILQNILESIISNAINYSTDGKEVIVRIEKNPAELIFIIKDSGIGIPKDEQARLFERFYRASNAKTFDTGGTGLGLYIASMLAKKIGAHILFESEEGKGSTFFVHVPYFGSGSLPENTTRV